MMYVCFSRWRNASSGKILELKIALRSKSCTLLESTEFYDTIVCHFTHCTGASSRVLCCHLQSIGEGGHLSLGNIQQTLHNPNSSTPF